MPCDAKPKKGFYTKQHGFFCTQNPQTSFCEETNAKRKKNNIDQLRLYKAEKLVKDSKYKVA